MEPIKCPKNLQPRVRNKSGRPGRRCSEPSSAPPYQCAALVDVQNRKICETKTLGYYFKYPNTIIPIHPWKVLLGHSITRSSQSKSVRARMCVQSKSNMSHFVGFYRVQSRSLIRIWWLFVICVGNTNAFKYGGSRAKSVHFNDTANITLCKQNVTKFKCITTFDLHSTRATGHVISSELS